jgi:hypothetical protein
MRRSPASRPTVSRAATSPQQAIRSTIRTLDFTRLEDANGHRLRARTEEAQAKTIIATRRTTLAARLRAIYGASLG